MGEARHVLVCGASAGIGRAAALAFAREGWKVTALARRAERLAALVPELEAAGAAGAAAVVADLAAPDGLAGVAAAVEAGLGPVDALVHNTGGPAGGPLLDAPWAAFAAAHAAHVGSLHALCQALVPGMRARGYGRVVAVMSTSVYEPIAGLGVSNSTRAAVAGYLKTLADELPPGLTANGVLPGFTDTERLEALAGARAAAAGADPASVRAAWAKAVPEGRLGRADETAAAIVFLCGPGAGYIRGVFLPVDGGRLRSI